MGAISDAFSSAFRNFLVDGIPASGDNEVIKAEARALGPLIEQAIGTVGLGAVGTAKTTKALLDADLAHPAGTTALVYADSTDANNDLYVKSGASGAGSWANTGALHLIMEALGQPYVDAAEAAADEAVATVENVALTSNNVRAEYLVQVFDGAVAIEGPPPGFTIPNGYTGHLSVVSAQWAPVTPFRDGDEIVAFNTLALSVGFDRTIGTTVSAITASNPFGVPRAATVNLKTIDGGVVQECTFAAEEGDLGYKISAQVFSAVAADEDQALTLLATAWRFKDRVSNSSTASDRMLWEAIAATGYILPPNAQIVTVAPSGAMFTHPKLANDAITDAGPDNPYVIAMKEGSYGGYAEWRLKPFTDLIGIGQRDAIVIWYENDDSASASTITNTSLFWQTWSSKCVNFHAWVRNCRYVNHLETSAIGPYSRQELLGVRFEHRGNADAVNNTWPAASQVAVGAGNSNGQVVTARHSILLGPGGGFSLHTPNDGADMTVPSYVDLEGNEVTATDPACAALRIVPVTVGAGCGWRLVGNSINGPILYESTQWVSADTSTRRDQIDVHGYGNSPTNFFRFINGDNTDGAKFRPRFTDEEGLKVNSTGSAIPVGKVLAHDDDPRFVRLMTSADPAYRYAGVSWEEIPAGKAGRVKTGGRIELSVDVFHSGGAAPVGTTFSIDPTTPGRLVIGGSLGLLPVVEIVTSPVSGSAAVIVKVAA